MGICHDQWLSFNSSQEQLQPALNSIQKHKSQSNEHKTSVNPNADSKFVIATVLHRCFDSIIIKHYLSKYGNPFMYIKFPYLPHFCITKYLLAAVWKRHTIDFSTNTDDLNHFNFEMWCNTFWTQSSMIINSFWKSDGRWYYN